MWTFPSKNPNFTWNGSTNRKVQDAEILVVKIYIGTSDHPSPSSRFITYKMGNDFV